MQKASRNENSLVEKSAALSVSPEGLMDTLRGLKPPPCGSAASGLGVRSEGFFGAEGQAGALIAFGQALASKRALSVYLCYNDLFLLPENMREEVSASLFREEHRYHVALPAPAEALASGFFRIAGDVSFYEIPEQTKTFGLLLSAPGVGAVMSGQGAEQTLLVWDNAALCCHDGLLSHFLPDSESVAYTPERVTDYEKTLYRLQEEEAPFLFAKDTPGGFFVPPALLPEKDPIRLSSQTSRLERHRKLFVQRAKGEGWTDVLPRLLLEAVSLNRSCRFSAASLFGRQDLTLRDAPLRATLQTMLSCLEQYPGYRVVWTEKPSPVWTALSRTRGALLSDFRGKTRHLYLSERYGCFGLQSWADSLPEDEDRGRSPLRKLLDEFQV